MSTSVPVLASPAVTQPEAAERGKAALLGQPGVRNVWQGADEWQIAVRDDGDARWGFAEAMCILLRHADALTPETTVAVIDDRARIAANSIDVVENSRLAEIRCRDATRIAGRTGRLL